MRKYNLTIGWLYPELMSTYGDRGNITVLQKRCEWRGIKAEIKRLDVGFDHKLLAKCDMLFMGGAQDRQQQIVAKDLTKKQKELKQMIEDATPGLYICGAYQFLGKYYKEASGTIVNGLGILDLYTENPGVGFSRLIGNTVARVLEDETIVGFENHGGRTYLGKSVKPWGEVLRGFGNNEEGKTEGAIYKNSFCSYFHGPILPKNPHFADLLIKLALERKYNSPINLLPLDDSLENRARKSIANRLDIDL